MRIEVVENPASEAADLLVRHAQAGHHIALSGGSTPRAAYRLAAERLRDWSSAVLWFGDDRAVPPDHEWSNYLMVRQALLDVLPEEGLPRVERVLGELGHEAAAGDYEARFREAGARLDLALMGLGPDAHTASLFPGKPEVEETSRLVVGVPIAGMEPQVPRVTMTIPAFDRAGEVAFLVSGADKADAVRRAFGPEPDLTAPAARVRTDLVILDAAAASRL
jgi:6-phosphogluconolactonase